MKKVFISTTSFAKDDMRPLEFLRKEGLEVCMNPLGRKLAENEIIGFLTDVDFLIAGTESLTRKVFESAKKLRIISRCGAGMDNVDIQAATEFGIKIYNTPYGPILAVAELTIGLILDLLRKITLADCEVKAGIWKKRMGNLLHEKKVGVVGFGKIGQKIAELLTPFGVDISYHDIHDKQSLLCSFKKMDDLLSWADIVTLHCTASADGKPIIGENELKRMKKTAFLINTSRGGLVDESALYRALSRGHLSGVALDVFEQEPYNGPLMKLENVVLTPHIGSYAKEARVEMEIQAVENLLKGLRNCGIKEFRDYEL